VYATKPPSPEPTIAARGVTGLKAGSGLAFEQASSCAGGLRQCKT
jgi:hypothetical protein